MKNADKQKDENEKRAQVYRFYENIKKGNQILSYEELEIAIETLKLAQQNIKQNNLNNTISQSNATKNDKSKSASSKLNSVDTSKKEISSNDETLQLPNYDWFVSKQDGKPISNTFTGSHRKHTTKGHFSTTTFNYKVWVSDVGKENAKIVADCFIQLPWWKGGLRETLSRSEYECSPSGLNKATERLYREWQRFMKDTKK